MPKMLVLVVTVILTVVTGGDANGLRGLAAVNISDAGESLSSNDNMDNQAFSGKIDWGNVPISIRSKIVREEVSLHPEIINHMDKIIQGYIKTFGSIVGKALGEAPALQFYENWRKQHIYDNLECVIWGNVEADFKKRDLTTVKKGDYLMLYKLHCEDAALFWGPVAATDKDHIQAGMTPGSRYKRDALVLDLSRDEMVHARPT